MSYEISPNAPEGVFTKSEQGELRITSYGMGYLAVQLAWDKKWSRAQALSAVVDAANSAAEDLKVAGVANLSEIHSAIIAAGRERIVALYGAEGGAP